MGCTFCATGQAGFDRHLDPGEIVEQVAHAMHHAPRPVTNVVFMGMGEPLANFGPTWDAVDAPARRLRDLRAPDHGVDRRHRARDAPHGRRGAAGHARGLAARAERRAARHDDPDQRPLPAARGHRRRARRRPPPRPPRHVRVRVHRRRERRARARRGARRAARAARTARHPREPHPAEPDRGLRRPGGHRSRTSGRSPTGSPRDGLTPTIRRNRGTDIDAACGQLRERANRAEGSPSTRMPR